jgi:hypothetical protein
MERVPYRVDVSWSPLWNAYHGVKSDLALSLLIRKAPMFLVSIALALDRDSPHVL